MTPHETCTTWGTRGDNEEATGIRPVRTSLAPGVTQPGAIILRVWVCHVGPQSEYANVRRDSRYAFAIGTIEHALVVEGPSAAAAILLFYAGYQ